jgi:hypothetical protein
MTIEASVDSLTAPTIVSTSSMVVTTRTHTYGSVAPTTGAHIVGDIVYSDDPATLLAVGWVCTVAGTPGTWKKWGTWVAPLTAPTYIKEISGTGYTNGNPTTKQFLTVLAGDVLIVTIEGSDVAPGDIPSGWTKIAGNAEGSAFWARVAADTSPYETVWTGLSFMGVSGTPNIIHGFVVRGCTPTGSPVNAYSINLQDVPNTITTTATAPAITTTVENTLLFFMISGYDYQATALNEAVFSFRGDLVSSFTGQTARYSRGSFAAKKWPANAVWTGTQAAIGTTGDATVGVSTLKNGGKCCCILVALKGA